MRLLLLLLAVAFQAAAQPYPSKPIRIVVPLAPGGTGDTLARLLGDELGRALHVAVVVENKPGSGGVIGSDTVAKSAPDGYTLLHTSNSHVINAALRPQLGYDPLKDFAAIARTADTHQILVANPSFPPNNVKELLEYCKTHKVFYGSAGNGSASHMNMELFKSLAGIDIEHVPYKGSSQSRTDLLAGRVQLVVDGLLPTLPLIRAHKLKPIALASSHRSVTTPEVPTMSEAGVRGYESDTWYALFAPAGLPPAVLDKLRSATDAALQSASLREKFLQQGAEPTDPSHVKLEAVMREDLARWSKLVAQAHIKAD